MIVISEELKTGFSGQGWERAVFGCSSSEFADPPYRTWKEAIFEALNIQESFGWNPKNPATAIGASLFLMIKNSLSSKKRGELEFYCSIGTSLDRFHGVDGFFKIGDLIVEIDLTANPEDWKDKKIKERKIIALTPAHMQDGYEVVVRKIVNRFNESPKKIS